MTTIMPSSYYQLSNLQPSTSSNSTSSAGNSLTQDLVSSLAAGEDGSQSSNDAYSLNLSPAAQQLLNSSSTSSASTISSSSFILDAGAASHHQRHYRKI